MVHTKKGLVRVGDWCFYDEDGRPFRGIGLNFCWESRDVDDSRFFKALHEDKRFSYEELIPKLAAYGVNFLRVWMVYWNLPVDWPVVANNSRYSSAPVGQRYNPSALERFRLLLALCEAHGVRLMVCLETHVGFLGEGWALNPYNIKNGGGATSPADFFANPLLRREYKKKLDCLLGIVGRSPAVAAWEFFNEIDNLCSDPSYSYDGNGLEDKNIADWHAEMGEYLRKNDVLSRPITTSVSHRKVVGLWTDAGMDINQHHVYCRTADIPEDLERELIANGRPHGLGEFANHWDWSLDFRTLEPEFSRDFVIGLYLGLFSTTPFVPLVWWWEYFCESGLFTVFSTYVS